MNQDQLMIMEHTIELSVSIHEGLRLIDKQLDSGCIYDSYEIMGSVLNGMEAIKKALPCVINYIPRNNIGLSTMQLRDILETIRSHYQLGEVDDAHLLIKETLIPVFEDWQDEIHHCFKPFICH